MGGYKLYKGKKYNIVAIVWSHLIAAIIVISTGGAWLSDVAIDYDAERLSVLLHHVLIASFFVFVFFYHKLFVTKSAILRISIVMICMIAYRFVCQCNVEIYDLFFMYTIFLMMVCMAFLENKRLVWTAFVNVVMVIAIISLFFYLGASLLRIIPETGITELIWGTWDTSSIRTFFNIYYESQSLTINETQMIFRNCGIFSEAPMYNFVLCMALGAELFISEKTNKAKCFVLIITIVTTLSTTGFLFLIFAGLFYWFDCVFCTKKITIHKIAFGIAFLSSIFMMILIVVQKTFSSSGRGSLNVRTDHFFACIRRWFESPIYGYGYLNMDDVLIDASYYQGLSVGLVYLLACGGILLTSVLIVPYLLNGLKAFKTSWRKEFLFETLFMILFFFTAVTGRPILTFFIAYVAICDDYNTTTVNIEKKKSPFPTKDYHIYDFCIYVLYKWKILLLSGIVLGVMTGAMLIFRNNRLITAIIVSFFAICIGILLAIFICYILFIMRNVFYSADEFRALFNINILGILYEKKVLKLPEKLIHLERDNKYRKISEELMYKEIRQRVLENSEPQCKILLTGITKQEVLDFISANLSQIMPERHFVAATNVNTNISTLQLLTECDFVILVEKENSSKLNHIVHEKKTVDYFKKEIIGAIIYS